MKRQAAKIPTPSLLGKRRNFHSNKEWWTRTMWALEATASHSDRMYGYGAALLTELARSGAASKEEKVLLDAVWEVTGTQMRESEVRRLLAEAPTTTEPGGRNPRSERVERIRGGSGSLYREVLAARLKVVLDLELGRQTSPLVCELAELQISSQI